MGTDMSLFSGVREGPPIEVLHMKARHDRDPSKVKINLTVGGYKDEQGKPWVLPVVRETEVALVSNPATTHEYLPALGSPEANRAAVELLLGSANPLVTQGRAFAIQSMGGTGPLRVGAEFLQQQLGCRSARYSDPTWINHRDIFTKSGFTDVTPYPYWNSAMKSLDFDGLLACMEKAPPLTVYILHPMAHNPTGIDPTREQWKRICALMKSRKLVPFFDCAYQGWASGDMDEDAWVVRHFASQGLELLVSQSFGKNLGLYGDRIGFLTLVVGEGVSLPALQSQLTLVLRPMYGNPCRPAAALLEKILLEPKKRGDWENQLRSMVSRVQGVRRELRQRLEALVPAFNWESITKQVNDVLSPRLLFPGWDVLVLGAERGTRNGSGRPPCLCDAKQWANEPVWRQPFQH